MGTLSITRRQRRCFAAPTLCFYRVFGLLETRGCGMLRDLRYAPRAFISKQTLGWLTLLHYVSPPPTPVSDEIGHNLGCRHDRESDADSEVEYAHGLRYCTGTNRYAQTSLPLAIDVSINVFVSL